MRLLGKSRFALQERLGKRKGPRRAELRESLASYPTTTHDSPPRPTVMEDEVSADDVFSSGHLWKQSTLFADPNAFDSTLFAPLQLDSKPVACFRPERVEQT
jgi:hypothetical protein